VSRLGLEPERDPAGGAVSRSTDGRAWPSMSWKPADHENTVGTVGFQEFDDVRMSVVGAFGLHRRQRTYDYLDLDPKTRFTGRC